MLYFFTDIIHPLFFRKSDSTLILPFLPLMTTSVVIAMQIIYYWYYLLYDLINTNTNYYQSNNSNDNLNKGIKSIDIKNERKKGKKENEEEIDKEQDDENNYMNILNAIFDKRKVKLS